MMSKRKPSSRRPMALPLSVPWNIKRGRADAVELENAEVAAQTFLLSYRVGFASFDLFNPSRLVRVGQNPASGLG